MAGVDRLSREQEVRLVGTLHDVAAAFARCARACRDGRAAVTPVIVRGMAAKRLGNQRRVHSLAHAEYVRSSRGMTQRRATRTICGSPCEG